MMQRATCLIGCLALGACSGEVGGEDPRQDEAGERGRAVKGGSPTQSYPYVGQLAFTGYGCSATLIGPRTVLTAAHCLYDCKTKTLQYPVSMDFVVKKSYGLYNPQMPEGYKQACAAGGSSGNNYYTSEMAKYDIGIMHLPFAVEEMPVAQLSSEAPQVGDEVTLVAWGSGEREEGQTTVRKVGEWRIEVKSSSSVQSEPGDSGGAVFDTEGRQISVNIGGYPDGTAVSLRLSKHAQWITGNMGSGDNASSGGSSDGGGDVDGGVGGDVGGQPSCDASLCESLYSVPGSSPSCYCDSACTGNEDCCPGYDDACGG